jgi:hypothetical protein
MNNKRKMKKKSCIEKMKAYKMKKTQAVPNHRKKSEESRE